MESGEFVTLSDYNIYLIRSGFDNQGNTLYIGNIVSFSVGNNTSNYINKDFYFNLYMDNTKIYQCDSSCKICLSSTECLSCVTNYLLFDTTCVQQCSIGYFTLRNGNCLLLNNVYLVLIN